MLNKIKSNIKNIPGWRTKRHIVVIESDDWGATRIPSIVSKNIAQIGGADFDLGQGFDDFDTLEQYEDLTTLFEVLSNHKDINGYNTVITANSIVANPDFKRIKESNYKTYFFKTINNNIELTNAYKEGINNHLFKPQYHAREHLNVMRWLDALQKNYKGVRSAFEQGIWSNTCNSMLDSHCMATYDYASEIEKEFIISSIKNGLNIFESIFGYKSISTIAPCYIWCDDITKAMVENGVRCFQSGIYQRLPYLLKTQTNKKQIFRYSGQRGKYGEVYLQRNVSFEPSSNMNYTNDLTIKNIDRAFFWGKPAIIQSHRINFVSGLNRKNRDRSLKLFDELLKIIIKKYADVEFMTSDQLYYLIKKDIDKYHYEN